jgi:hypothetical protein
MQGITWLLLKAVESGGSADHGRDTNRARMDGLSLALHRLAHAESGPKI